MSNPPEEAVPRAGGNAMVEQPPQQLVQQQVSVDVFLEVSLSLSVQPKLTPDKEGKGERNTARARPPHERAASALRASAWDRSMCDAGSSARSARTEKKTGPEEIGPCE